MHATSSTAADKREQHRRERGVYRILIDSGLQLGSDHHVLVLIGVRVGLLQVLGERGQLGLGLRHRDPGLQAAFDTQIAFVAGFKRFWIRGKAGVHHHRRIERRANHLIHPCEPVRRHSDDCELDSVHAYFPAEDGAVRRELLFPQRMVQNHHRVPSGNLVLIGTEGAPELRLHSHRVEQVAGHQHTEFHLRQRIRLG